MSTQSDDGSERDPRSYDEELRERARKQLKAKAEFRQHLTSFVVVNGFLVALWAITGRGYFWPVWPILGWGVGLTFHALSLGWNDDSPSTAQIEAQAERLRLRDERRGRALPDGAPDPSFGQGDPTVPPQRPALPGPWDQAPGPQDAR
jgi:hypothetical protein